MDKWIKYDADGTIRVISEGSKPGFTKVTVTEQQYLDMLAGKYLYISGLVTNESYEAPQTISTEIQEQLNRRAFGQRVIAEFQVEFEVEQLLATDQPALFATIALTKSLFEALNNGWLGMAIASIKGIPAENLTDIITADVLVRYRNKIHDYMGYPPVETYNA